MQHRYQKALKKWQERDQKAREVIKMINRSNQNGGYYLITKDDVIKVNQAREAWLELLSVARSST